MNRRAWDVYFKYIIHLSKALIYFSPSAISVILSWNMYSKEAILLYLHRIWVTEITCGSLYLVPQIIYTD